MKKILILAFAAATLLFAGCSSEELAPAPEGVKGFSSEALTGAVKLSWNQVTDENALYTCLEYDVHGTHYKRNFSKYTTEYTVEDLLARYGAIEFSIYNVNCDEVRSADVSSIKIQCDPVPASYIKVDESATVEAVEATDGSSESDEWGGAKALVDGSTDQFFVTAWELPGEISFPSTATLTLSTECNKMQFTFLCRSGYKKNLPTHFYVEVSNEEEDLECGEDEQGGWIIVEEVDLREDPGIGNYESWESQTYDFGDEAYKYVRFVILASGADGGEPDCYYYCIAEIECSCAFQKETFYDPENGTD